MMISHTFWLAIKLSARPMRDLAKAVGFHPSYLSRILHYRARIRPDDDRIYRLASLLGIPKEKALFETKGARRAS